jgi:hypothetical protein
MIDRTRYEPYGLAAGKTTPRWALPDMLLKKRSGDGAR